MPYIPTTPEETRRMLSVIGVEKIEDLFADIPEEIRLKRPMDLPKPMSEAEVKRHMEELANKNKVLINFIGAGAYERLIPTIVPYILSRWEIYSAYTPYQPEVSQGTLQMIFEFQSLMCELTGMEVATASHYDGATAAAEAALMSCADTRKHKVLVSRAVHPQYRDVIRTYATGQRIEIVEIPIKDGRTDLAELEKLLAAKDVAGVILQNPNFLGQIESMAEAVQLAHKAGALGIAVFDPISLGVLAPPGEYDADIAVGEGQSLGLPLSYGGPYLGIVTSKERLVRRLPGRLIGATRDVDGKRGFVMTLATREQHIRREKATSNICTNEALCATAATIYLAALGKEGLKEVARQCVLKSHYAYEKLTSIPGVTPVFTGPFFCEFALKTDKLTPKEVYKGLADKGFAAALDLTPYYPEYEGAMLFAVTEARTKAEIDALAAAMGGLLA